MNKKPRATREKKEVSGSGTNRAAPKKKKYRLVEDGEKIRLTDEHFSIALKEWIGNQCAFDASEGESFDSDIHLPMRREVKSPKGSAQAKPKPSQSHPHPRRPKK